MEEQNFQPMLSSLALRYFADLLTQVGKILKLNRHFLMHIHLASSEKKTIQRKYKYSQASQAAQLHDFNPRPLWLRARRLMLGEGAFNLKVKQMIQLRFAI